MIIHTTPHISNDVPATVCGMVPILVGRSVTSILTVAPLVVVARCCRSSRLYVIRARCARVRWYHTHNATTCWTTIHTTQHGSNGVPSTVCGMMLILVGRSGTSVLTVAPLIVVARCYRSSRLYVIRARCARVRWYHTHSCNNRLDDHSHNTTRIKRRTIYCMWYGAPPRGA